MTVSACQLPLGSTRRSQTFKRLSQYHTDRKIVFVAGLAFAVLSCCIVFAVRSALRPEAYGTRGAGTHRSHVDRNPMQMQLYGDSARTGVKQLRATRFCSACGQPISLDAQFCASCGASQELRNPPPKVVMAQPLPRAMEGPSAPPVDQVPVDSQNHQHLASASK